MINDVLIFDIETVADVKGYRQLKNLDPALSDTNVYQIMCNERLSETGATFMRHHLQKIVAISLVMKRPNKRLKVWTLGRDNLSEKEIITRFFKGIDGLSPTLVSWNGGGFDLPVLNYRALIHGITAQRYFEIGDLDNSFKFNNYQNRYHWRHIDLMDVLAGFQPRPIAALDEIAKLCGFPGKLDMDGAAVQERYEAGDIESICNYCETDVLNTYLVYLRFELLRGNLTLENYTQEIEEVQSFLLEQEHHEHFGQFLDAWVARQS